MAKLRNKDITEMLRTAYADTSPDKADEILSAAVKKNDAPTFSLIQEDHRGRYLRRGAMAAAVIFVIAGLILTFVLIRSHTPYATVTIESDECVEITLSRDLRPLSVSGKNSAAIRLAREISGRDISDAIDSALDAMLSSDHLSDDNNTVLITADAPENAGELLDDAFDAAVNSFDDSGFRGAILTTVASDNKDVQRISRRCHISVGKAEMVRDIIRQDRSFSATVLSRLSVNDLNFLRAFKGLQYKDISVTGESRGCISPDVAEWYVAADLSDTSAAVSASLCADMSGLYYSVTAQSGERVYIYRLSALGEILSISQGADLQTAQTADSQANEMPKEGTEPTEKASEAAGSDGGYQTIITTVENPAETPQTNTTEGKSSQTEKPQSPTTAKQLPTSKPTERKQPATSASKPTEAPREPEMFTSKQYFRSSGITNAQPSSSKRPVSLRRIENGYDTFCTAAEFPYSPAGSQGNIAALVSNTDQLRSLIGHDDSRYDDSYFSAHALYIYMSRDVDYHWIKAIDAAYIDGGTLYLLNSEPVGYYITADSGTPERIYTVIYELNKSDLSGIVNMLEYTE